MMPVIVPCITTRLVGRISHYQVEERFLALVLLLQQQVMAWLSKGHRGVIIYFWQLWSDSSIDRVTLLSKHGNCYSHDCTPRKAFLSFFVKLFLVRCSAVNRP